MVCLIIVLDTEVVGLNSRPIFDVGCIILGPTSEYQRY